MNHEVYQKKKKSNILYKKVKKSGVNVISFAPLFQLTDSKQNMVVVACLSHRLPLISQPPLDFDSFLPLQN